MIVRRKSIIALALCSALLAMPLALHAAGGGGGGGAMPSGSQIDPAAEYRKGIDAYQAQDYKAAVTALRKVVGAAPRHAPAQYLLGSSYMMQSDFKKAKRPLEAAVRADPQMVEARRDLALTLVRLEEPAKAAEQRAALAALKAACAAPCADGARIDAALAAVDAALGGTMPVAIRAPLPAEPARTEALYVAAVSLVNEGQYDGAIAMLEAGLAESGPDSDLLTYLGFANRKLGRFDEARSRYEAALALSPDHLGALEYYGELKLELGDRAGAEAHLARLDRLCGFGCQQADELRLWLSERGPSAP